jgi:small-conductance mechanosensitive channel
MVFLTLLAMLVSVAVAQSPGAPRGEAAAKTHSVTDSASAPTAHPVLLDDDTVFMVQTGSGTFSARERAVVVSQRLAEVAAVAATMGFVPESLKIVETPGGREIVYADRPLIRVTDADAAPAVGTDSLAAVWHERMRARLDGTKAEADLWKVLTRVAGVAGILLLIVFVELLVFRLARRAKAAITRYADSGRLPAFRIQGVTLLTAERSRNILETVFKTMVTVAHLIVAYGALLLLFSVFPWTHSWAGMLFTWSMRPLRAAVGGFIDFVPDLFHIIVVLVLAHLFLRVLKRLTHEVEAGNLTLPGFYPDWGRPTLNIVRFITYAFALVLIFPHLPGSDSVAFKGVSVFLGVLISLGSSAAFSNIIAGIVMTYMRSFRLGDRVQVGDVIGDVTEKTLLVTRIKTFHGETVTLPNSALLAGNTVNYTVAAAGHGLLLHTQVTIGYDVPWRTVHALLIDAARKTPSVQANPEPFVLQKALDDFYVTYEINMYTLNPSRMSFIYSDLHQNIQDAFFTAGVEIMSPHYRALRKGDEPAIPPQHRKAQQSDLDATKPYEGEVSP